MYPGEHENIDSDGKEEDELRFIGKYKPEITEAMLQAIKEMNLGKIIRDGKVDYYHNSLPYTSFYCRGNVNLSDFWKRVDEIKAEKV